LQESKKTRFDLIPSANLNPLPPRQNHCTNNHQKGTNAVAHNQIGHIALDHHKVGNASGFNSPFVC
tara:strand:+ start:64474 stop:64671 length:198 start_codon:yes stop_codon:yes gene_type:complete